MSLSLALHVRLQLRRIIFQDNEDENVLYLYDKSRPWSSCSLNSLPYLLQHLFNGTELSKQKVVFLSLLCMSLCDNTKRMDRVDSEDNE